LDWDRVGIGTNETTAPLDPTTPNVRELRGEIAGNGQTQAELVQTFHFESVIDAAAQIRASLLIPIPFLFGRASLFGQSLYGHTNFQTRPSFLFSGIDAVSSLEADLTVRVEFLLDGAIGAASQTEEAHLNMRHALVGSVQAQSSLVGSLSVEISGQIEAASGLTADLVEHMVLRGQVEAFSTMTAEAHIDHSLEGSIEGDGKTAGDMLSLTNLSGTLDATSNAQADTVRRSRRLLGIVFPRTDLSADLDIVPPQIELAGEIHATAALEITWLRVRDAASDMAAASAMEAALRAEKAIEGSLTGNASITGSLRVQRDIGAQIEASSSLVAGLLVDYELRAQVAGESHVSGSFDVEMSVALPAISSLGGETVVDWALLGITSGLSDLEATVRRDRAIAARSDALGSLDASLGRKRQIVASVDATSSIEARLGVRSGVGGDITAASTVEARVQIQLDGQIEGTTDLRAELGRHLHVGGDILAFSIPFGWLHVTRRIDALVPAESDVQALLGFAHRLDASIGAESAIDGQMQRINEMEGRSDAQASLQADTDIRRHIEGSIDAESGVSGGLIVSIKKRIARGGIARREWKRTVVVPRIGPGGG
jgi:hypothetical protein